jgi:hypothetical protein
MTITGHKLAYIGGLPPGLHALMARHGDNQEQMFNEMLQASRAYLPGREIV